MSSNTDNLKLLKANPVEDGNDVFNIDTFLNANWDKVDNWAGEVDTQLNDLAKKDLRANKVYADIFSTTLDNTHLCWNKWCNVVKNSDINVENTPEVGSDLWYEVFTGGDNTRAFQIAIGCYSQQRKTFIRYKQDSTWTGWKQLATTDKPTEYSIVGQNGFAIVGGSKATYYKTQDGEVVINCLLRNSATITNLNTIIFTLPTGYRPSTSARIVGTANGQTAIFLISPSGEVTLNGVSSGTVSYNDALIAGTFLAQQ